MSMSNHVKTRSGGWDPMVWRWLVTNPYCKYHFGSSRKLDQAPSNPMQRAPSMFIGEYVDTWTGASIHISPLDASQRGHNQQLQVAGKFWEAIGTAQGQIIIVSADNMDALRGVFRSDLHCIDFSNGARWRRVWQGSGYGNVAPLRWREHRPY